MQELGRSVVDDEAEAAALDWAPAVVNVNAKMLQVLIAGRNWIALLREKAAEDDGARGWPPGHGVHGGNLNVLALGIRSRMSL
jgi:hypothetical protein